jgi:hypothetical protein
VLPKSVETPRLRRLQDIVANSAATDLAGWPMLNKEDYVLVGGIVVLFSYIDLNLHRILEVFDHRMLLQEPWAGNVGKLRATEVAEATQSLPCWDDPGRKALGEIEELRSLRNLVAHFAIRRFPADDAFLFVAKSARDFKRQFGTDPPPGSILTAIIEVEQVKEAIRHIEHVQNWLARAAPKLEHHLSPRQNQGAESSGA